MIPPGYRMYIMPPVALIEDRSSISLAQESRVPFILETISRDVVRERSNPFTMHYRVEQATAQPWRRLLHRL